MSQEQTQPLDERQAHHPEFGSAASRGDSRNVGTNERVASLIGGALALFAGLRRGGMRKLLLTALGGMLVYRGATGYCQINKQLGRDTSHRTGRGLLQPREISTSASITIGSDPEALYAFWRDVENLPSVMSFISEVRSIDERRSHWVAHLPHTGRMEWEAEITDDRPNESIGWRSREDHPLRYRGSIHFHPAPGERGTEVVLHISYQPPGGAGGAKLARQVTPLLKQKLREDLRHFKQQMETGEIPTARRVPGESSMTAPKHLTP